MSTNPSNYKIAKLQLTSVFSPRELEELVQRIIDSGELGRSKIYALLLKFLVESSLSGTRVKEFDIAFEVLGKSADFDISKNSAVRVCVHQLRKKLDSYYQKYKESATHRIVIPSGRYTIEAVLFSDDKTIPAASPEIFRPLFSLERILLASIVILLVANLAYMINRDRVQLLAPGADNGIWQELLDDDLPILLVMGDYYIFGEENARGDIQRMVNEFNNNSNTDLDNLQLSDVLTTENYLDLDLTSMPEGSAFALARIVPILQKENKRVNVAMMADLTNADLRENHIVYIGYISALDKLSNRVFAMSGLQIGRSYDELVNLQTQEVYASGAFTAEENEPFHDYGLFSTFPMTDTNRIVIIAGMRNAGLMHVAQALSNEKDIGSISQSLANSYGEVVTNFEVLYEVFGIDRMNFNARLVYKERLESDRIWRKGIVGPP